MNFTGTTTYNNIDVNDAVEVVSESLPSNCNYETIADVLPGYVVPSTYKGVTEGPVYVPGSKQIVFYYQGNVY